MTDAELKSCPCCGGMASTWTTDAYSCDSAERVLGCEVCNLYIPYGSVFESEVPDSETIATWNTRADLPAAVTVDQIEAVTMHFLGHPTGDPSPHLDWPISRQWTSKGAKKRMQNAFASVGFNPAPVADASILTMKLSGNREEHWVRITCDGRTFDVRKYDGEYLNRAEYERDTLRHVLLGEPKPRIADDKYADPESAPGEQPDAEREAARVLLDADDYMPAEAKIAAIKAHVMREGKVRPVAVVEGWRAALRALSGQDTTGGEA